MFAGVYFFLVNIVLVNMLIAMMARTFSSDIEINQQLYYMQKYDLLIEYVKFMFLLLLCVPLEDIYLLLTTTRSIYTT